MSKPRPDFCASIAGANLAKGDGLPQRPRAVGVGAQLHGLSHCCPHRQHCRRVLCRVRPVSHLAQQTYGTRMNFRDLPMHELEGILHHRLLVLCALDYHLEQARLQRHVRTYGS